MDINIQKQTLGRLVRVSPGLPGGHKVRKDREGQIGEVVSVRFKTFKPVSVCLLTVRFDDGEAELAADHVDLARRSAFATTHISREWWARGRAKGGWVVSGECCLRVRLWERFLTFDDAVSFEDLCHRRTP